MVDEMFQSPIGEVVYKPSTVRALIHPLLFQSPIGEVVYKLEY